jgi:hypothetical protein
MERMRELAGFVKRLYLELHNYKLGMLSALAQGAVVYYINHKFGLVAALLAALKEALGSFIAGGFFGRITERFSEIDKWYVAYPLGMVVPTVIAHSLIGVVHYTTGTPVPLWSTVIPMMISMFVYTPATIFVLRRGLFRVNKSKPSVRERRMKARKEADENLDTPPQLARVSGEN